MQTAGSARDVCLCHPAFVYVAQAHPHRPKQRFGRVLGIKIGVPQNTEQVGQLAPVRQFTSGSIHHF